MIYNIIACLFELSSPVRREKSYNPAPILDHQTDSVRAPVLSSYRINLEYLNGCGGPIRFIDTPRGPAPAKPTNILWQVLRGLLFTEFRRLSCSLCLAHQERKRGYTWTAFPRRFLPRATFFFFRIWDAVCL